MPFPAVALQASLTIGCTPRGLCDNTLLRRVLRRFSWLLSRKEGFLEGVLPLDFKGRKGSKKGV